MVTSLSSSLQPGIVSKLTHKYPKRRTSFIIDCRFSAVLVKHVSSIWNRVFSVFNFISRRCCRRVWRLWSTVAIVAPEGRSSCLWRQRARLFSMVGRQQSRSKTFCNCLIRSWDLAKNSLSHWFGRSSKCCVTVALMLSDVDRMCIDIDGIWSWESETRVDSLSRWAHSSCSSKCSWEEGTMSLSR